MSIAVMDDAPGKGWLANRIRRIFGPHPSVELQKLGEATKRLEDAATAIEATATKMQGVVDPLGELVLGLRAGPSQRRKPTTKAPTSKRSGSPRRK